MRRKRPMNREWSLRALLMAALITVMLTAGQMAVADDETVKTTEMSCEKPSDMAGSRDLDVLMLDNDGYKKDRKGPVKFTHKKHASEYRVLCWDCHHDFKDGQNTWVAWGETKKCRQCHDPQKKELTNIKLQKAFHYNCKGCHRALAKEKKKAGAFDKCTGCHIKTEKQ